jgi:ElaB/YqjD/DUF883 family membrane-anchored ribosome-binding protein
MGKNITSIDNATAGAHQTIDKVSQAARPAVDRVTTGAHQVVDKLAGAATSAAETISAKGEQLKLAQDRLTEASRDYVRENPLTSIGIAVAAGFFLSRLLSSR